MSGWYLFNGASYRDTDWFIVVLDEEGAGFIDCTIDAESGTYLFELFPRTAPRRPWPSWSRSSAAAIPRT